jgi:hypothetical protein
MYADGGYTVKVAAYLARRAQVTAFPATPEAVYDALEEMLGFCVQTEFAPTLGVFALWCGVSIPRLWQVENDTSDPRNRAITVAKEVIRTVIEQSAIDGSFNPLLYFNQMKSQFGLAENQTVTIRTDDNTQELDEDEYQQRVELVQRADGTYGEG